MHVVKMDNDGRTATGFVSASRLEDVPEEKPMPDPSDKHTHT